jgi:hypothetical protein
LAVVESDTLEGPCYHVPMLQKIVKFFSTPITPEAGYFKFIWPLVAIISIPHELCHYLMARILGIPVKLTLMAVTHEEDFEIEAWKYILIALAPSIAGLLAYIYLLSIGLFAWDRKLAVMITLLAIIWQLGCRADYANVIEALKEEGGDCD